jgi:hypothetical protein
VSALGDRDPRRAVRLWGFGVNLGYRRGIDGLKPDASRIYEVCHLDSYDRAKAA